MVDLAKIGMPEFDIELSSLGLIHCGPFRPQIENKLLELFKGAGTTADEFARHLLSLLCRKPPAGERTVETPVEFAETQVMPDADTETFAERFLGANAWLVAGGSALSRAEGESAREYLMRVFRFRHKRRQQATTATSLLQKELLSRTRLFDQLRGSCVEELRILEAAKAAYSSHLDVFSKSAIEALRRSSQFKADIGQSLSLTRILSNDATRMIAEQAKITQQFRAWAENERALAATISTQMTALFRMPAAQEISWLNETVEANRALQGFMAREAELTRIARSIQTPWINIESPLVSLRSVTELAAIAKAVKGLPIFDPQLTKALRDSLGDWRKLVIPDEILIDPLKRLDFYSGLGFNRELANFPSPAYGAVLSATAIRPKALPPRVRKYESVRLEVESDDDPESLMHFAYERLFRFECRIREFIDELMTRVFGEQWIKHQVPSEIRKQWEEKRDKAAKHGEAGQPLINYADFTDYQSIICRGDNWKKAFEPVFGRKESVQESFYRLFPIRLCTMHARPITQEDILLLHVEVSRILKAIKTR